jgi:hypothetical protein
MALIRIEPRRDEATGKYFIEIYHPHDAAAPFVTTAPRYGSEAAAETDIIAILAAASSSAGPG